MMIPTQLYLEPNQEKRIISAFHKRKGCRIKARKQARGNSCRGEMLLTPKQWMRYQNAANGESITLPFEHNHLVENMKHKGGFLPLIAAALAPIIGGVAGGLIEKEIAGSGIYKRKKRSPKKNKKTSGSGMYLNPYTYYKRNATGSGMYLTPYKPRK